MEGSHACHRHRIRARRIDRRGHHLHRRTISPCAQHGSRRLRDCRLARWRILTCLSRASATSPRDGSPSSCSLPECPTSWLVRAGSKHHPHRRRHHRAAQQRPEGHRLRRAWRNGRSVAGHRRVPIHLTSGRRSEEQSPPASSSPPGSTTSRSTLARRRAAAPMRSGSSARRPRSPPARTGAITIIRRRSSTPCSSAPWAELGATLLEDAWVDANKVLLVDSNPRQLLPPPRHYADRPSGRPGAYYRDRAGHPADRWSVRNRERARRTSRGRYQTAPRGAEGRPERADLYSMRRWRPPAERRKYSAVWTVYLVVGVVQLGGKPLRTVTGWDGFRFEFPLNRWDP